MEKIVNECTHKKCIFKSHLNRYLRQTIVRMLSKRERPESATLKFNGNTYGSMYGQQLEHLQLLSCRIQKRRLVTDNDNSKRLK